MKTTWTYIVLIFLGFSLIGCQEEAIEIQRPPADEAFNATEALARQIQRVATKDGSDDNIITGGSCVSFELPVNVVVNGQEITINSEQDLDTVERIIDQFEEDNDDVEVIFPVTIILSDYTTIEINSEDELEDYVEACIEEGIDDDIECIDFIYPLEVSVYDTDNQIAEIVTLVDDKSLFLFLDDLEDNILVQFNFPVELVLADSTNILVYDNQQLAEAIENAEDTCDEDDDLDFDDDDVSTEELDNILSSSDWVITYFFDESDQTDLFNNWTFTFESDRLLIAVKETNTFNGSWESYGDSGELELELEFGSEEPLELLNEDWKVIEFSTSKIELEDTSGERLIFETN